MRVLACCAVSFGRLRLIKMRWLTIAPWVTVGEDRFPDEPAGRYLRLNYSVPNFNAFADDE